MSEKLKNCGTCGKEIAVNAKRCPQCGAKNPQPIYKKWWFWLIVVFVIAIIAGNDDSDNKKNKVANDNTSGQEETIVYTAYDVTELFDALEDNALKAQNTFKGQYVELTGYLGTIDSDGKYIGLEANSDDMKYVLQSVHCTLKKGSNQLEQVMELKKGDKLVVKGKITSVGEVLGYSLDIDSIE